MNLGRRLQWLRNYHQWILEDVHERSGLAIAYLSQLEHGGKTNPTRNALSKLAEAFGCTVGLLFGDYDLGDLTKLDMSRANPSAFALGQRFAAHVAALPETDRRQLLEMHQAERFQFVCGTLINVMGISKVDVAYSFGHCMRAHNEALLLDGPGVADLEQLLRHFGIPAEFILSGKLPNPGEVVDPAILLSYGAAVMAANQANVAPAKLEQLIREHAAGSQS